MLFIVCFEAPREVRCSNCFLGSFSVWMVIQLHCIERDSECQTYSVHNYPDRLCYCAMP